MGLKEDFSGILLKKRAQLELIAARINKSKKSGTFYRYSVKKRNSLLSKFKKLTRKVDQLKWQMKLAAVGGTIAVLGNTQDAIAQTSIGPFVKRDRASNPLRYPLDGWRLRPTIIDLDNDGDYDIVVGGDISGSYDMKVFENVGTNTNPMFNDYDLVDPGLNTLYLSGDGSPSFADLNGDGLMDLIVGVSGSVDRIQYFVNNGGIQLGEGAGRITFTDQSDDPWDDVAKTGNPFYGIFPGSDPVPFLIDFDSDGDMDVFIGHDYDQIDAGVTSVHYYENDGNSNFSIGSFTTSPIVDNSPINYGATPSFADIDQDGNLDFIMGRHYGDVRFFKGNGTNFTEQTGPWDPIAKTGNPFDGIDFGYQSATAFADFDNDGDLDMVFGSVNSSYKYQAGDNYGLNYFVNQGNAVFEKQPFLKNPFNGIDVGQEATPVLVDIDGDGDLDAVIGAKYAAAGGDPEFKVYTNNGGVFSPDHESSLALISLEGYNYKVIPSFVDIDNDGDLDLFVIADDETFFLRNNEGEFETEESPIDVIAYVSSGYEARFSITFMDLEGDGDFDAFIGSSTSSYSGVSKIDFIENQGTPEVPSFVGGTEPAPFDTEIFDRQARVSSADVDNDGDMDIVVSETIYDGVEKTNFRLFINNGDGSFTEDTLPILGLEKISGRSSINLVDFDNDGDLDAFVGLGRSLYYTDGGIISYYENDNPAPVTTINAGPRIYIYGSGPLVVDAALTISDSDADQIAKAVVVIQGYVNGDLLGFTPQGNVTGSFNTGTGILTLSGLASVSVYQDVLRSITYNYTGAQPSSAGKKGSSSGRTVTVNKTIGFSVFDSDLTTPSVQSLAISLTVPNVIPVVASSVGASTFSMAPIFVDATIAVSDTDDADLVGAIVQISASTFVSGEDDLLFISQNGITGSYNGTSGVLALTGIATVADYQTALQSIQYQNTSGTPTGATRIVEFSVDDGESFSSVVNKTVSISVPPPNVPPTITPNPITVAFNGLITLDLSTIATDSDGNLDPNTFAIVQQPSSGVTGSIAGTTLTINYAGSNFAGSDNVIIEVYDLANSRAEATINITVNNQAPLIANSSLNTAIGNSVILDLSTIISDPDNNLNPLSYAVIPNVAPTPTRVAMATISNSILTLDYTGSSFAGTDYVTIEACDLGGLCTSAEISIIVAGEVVVRNGMSPNGDGLNDYFDIANITALGAQNKVSIFTRWGDKVFEIENYDNISRRFEGKADGGKELSSGVYFYKIEFLNGQPELTGYLTIKR
ncbi:MAG: FG-GAP-like repeat-containing protein [Cyclobacteriaceae bacterium]